MTEQSREQIERDRESIKAHLPPSLWMMVDRQCDMALAKKDAEAECERLRESIQKYADHVCEGWCNTNGGQGKFKDCQGCQIYNLATPPPEDKDK